MTKDEYQAAKAELQKKHDAELHILACECAKSNNVVEVGDIVIDHCRAIRVAEIRLSLQWAYPECVYVGELLKKDLTPRKNTATEMVWQCNIQTHIKRGEEEK